MKGSVDLSNVEEGGSGFDLVPEDWYNVSIIEVKDGMSKNNDPMPNVKMSILDGKYKEQWLWDNILIPSLDSPSVKILGRSKHFLHVIGEPYEDKVVEYDTDNWVYKKLRVKVFHDEYKGKTRAKIDAHDFYADRHIEVAKPGPDGIDDEDDPIPF